MRYAHTTKQINLITFVGDIFEVRNFRDTDTILFKSLNSKESSESNEFESYCKISGGKAGCYKNGDFLYNFSWGHF